MLANSLDRAARSDILIVWCWMKGFAALDFESCISRLEMDTEAANEVSSSIAVRRWYPRNL
jgi:hypothetical protein